MARGGDDTQPLELSVQGVGMTFAHRHGPLRALDGIDVGVARGRFLAIVGPNGCGKSTLVRVMAGLVRPTEGTIFHRGQRVTEPDRSRLLMFQQPTLFPWLTVAKNIDFALRANAMKPERRRPLIEHYLALTGLSGFEDSYPRQLSGGMLQRAELARAFAVRPKLLLMDEPFAAVDSLSRLVLQEELTRFRATDDMAFVMVTHDVREAVFVADQVLLMTKRPGQAKRIFDVGRERVRTPSWRSTSRFASLCDEILSGLREEMDVNVADGVDVDLAERASVA